MYSVFQAKGNRTERLREKKSTQNQSDNAQIHSQLGNLSINISTLVSCLCNTKYILKKNNNMF